MRKRNLPVVLTLAFVLAALAGCDMLAKARNTGPKPEINNPPQEVEIIIPVRAELPKRGDISAHLEIMSRIEAENRVQVIAEGMGECLQVNVEEGDTVKEGQILAELDKKEMLTTIGQTQVQVRQTKTAYERARNGCEMGLTPEADRDNAKFAYEQALASLEMQQVQLSKLTVRAPISGLLTQKLVQPGQMISAGSPVFTVLDPDSFIIVIYPVEAEMRRLQPGQKAKVFIELLDEEFEATVRRINPNVDPVSGTVKVILDFDSETRAKLREAAFARVRLVMDTHQNTLLVPKDAVLEENARKYLFVVDTEQADPNEEDTPPESLTGEQTAAPAQNSETAPEQNGPEEKPVFVAKRVEINTGFEDSNFIEVVDGIDDSALIVVLGQHTLKSGSRVTVTNANDEILARAGLSAKEAIAAAKKRRQEATGASRRHGQMH